jgi:hypothetical protein
VILVLELIFAQAPSSCASLETTPYTMIASMLATNPALADVFTELDRFLEMVAT